MCYCNPNKPQKVCKTCIIPEPLPYKTEEEKRFILRDRGVKGRYLKADLSEFKGMDWLKHSKNGLFISGPAGCGKTRLLCALLKHDLEHGKKVQIATVSDILDQIKRTFSPDSEKTEFDIIDFYCEIDNLYIDDFGAEVLNDWAYSIIFKILDYRYGEMCRTLISSNKTYKDLNAFVGERITSRVMGLCGDEILMAGDDKRIKRA